jgi:trans-aconitate 2-methyltransferase
MTSWNPTLYLRFENERTQAARDLLHRVPYDRPSRVIDLGCGPGNSTVLLRRRWPEAEIIGLDNSESMLEEARKTYPKIAWQRGDIGQWEEAGAFDIVFANASLQWIPDHEHLIPRLVRSLRAGGYLAAQLPAIYNQLGVRIIRELAERSEWRAHGLHQIEGYGMDQPERYYDYLSRAGAIPQLWETLYFHVMDSPDEAVEWYRSTGLRPYLALLPAQEDQTRFLEQLARQFAGVLSRQTDGRVLFPFRRFFLLAQKP